MQERTMKFRAKHVYASPEYSKRVNEILKEYAPAPVPMTLEVFQEWAEKSQLVAEAVEGQPGLVQLHRHAYREVGLLFFKRGEFYLVPEGEPVNLDGLTVEWEGFVRDYGGSHIYYLPRLKGRCDQVLAEWVLNKHQPVRREDIELDIAILHIPPWVDALEAEPIPGEEPHTAYPTYGVILCEELPEWRSAVEHYASRLLDMFTESEK